ncbi:MAG: RNA 2',3'-cyclic phosphodiesterase [Planctomycetota bacterium]
MAKTRTFIAVEVADEVRDRVESLTAELGARLTGVRWSSPESLHYTLHFLGDLTDHEVAEVCQLTAEAAGRVARFALQSAGLGVFPSPEKPRTLWVGASDGGDALHQLRAEIDQQLQPLGFRGENRPYIPHLTIGKLARPTPAAAAAFAGAMAQLGTAEFGVTAVANVAVFSSQLLRHGPSYTRLARLPLAQA